MFVSTIDAHGGGGDGPEDWVRAYNIVLNNLKWRNGIKLIIHIADAQPHGSPSEYTSIYSFPEEGQKLDELNISLAQKNFSVSDFLLGDIQAKLFKDVKEFLNYMKIIIMKLKILIKIEDILDILLKWLLIHQLELQGK